MAKASRQWDRVKEECLGLALPYIRPHALGYRHYMLFKPYPVVEDITTNINKTDCTDPGFNPLRRVARASRQRDRLKEECLDLPLPYIFRPALGYDHYTPFKRAMFGSHLALRDPACSRLRSLYAA